MTPFPFRALSNAVESLLPMDLRPPLSPPLYVNWALSWRRLIGLYLKLLHQYTLYTPGIYTLLETGCYSSTTMCQYWDNC